MRTVVLLGTSHPLQCGTDAGAPVDALATMLRSLCIEHGVQTIAEEIELDGLNRYGVAETIGASVCRTLGIQSAYCDASIAERNEIRKHLPLVPPVDPTLPYDRRLRLELDAEFEQLKAAREDFWMNKILQLNRWPILFICGANHFGPFRAKLIQGGITVINGPADWKP